MNRAYAYFLRSFLRPHLWAFPTLVMLGVASAAVEGIGVAILVPLISYLFRSPDVAVVFPLLGRATDIWPAANQTTVLLSLLFGVLFLFASKAAIQYLYSFVALIISKKIVLDLRASLFDSLLRADFQFVSSSSSGRMFNIVQGETWLAGEFVVAVAKGLVSLFSITAFCVILFLLSPRLTVVSLAGLTLIGVVTIILTRRVRRRAAVAKETSAELSSRLIESLEALKVIKLFSREKREFRRFTNIAARDRAASVDVEKAAAIIGPITEVLFAPLLLVIVAYSWSMGIPAGTLVAFLVLLYRLQPHVRMLNHVRVELSRALPTLDHIRDVLQKPEESSGSRAFSGLARSIRFENVSFTYVGSDTAAICDASFEIVKNRLTAFVGSSGSGKSTVAALLCRFFDPTRGTMSVDEVDVRSIRLTDWRERIAFAGQDAELLGDTILDVISYGAEDWDRDSVQDAARAAQVHEFVALLPDGLDTPVRRRGHRFSVGQRQRIAIARALRKNSEILILDEATSALDAALQTAIETSINELRGKRTIVIIAHRLSTIQSADHVIVLHQGRVIEQGSPRELLSDKDSSFYHMWKLEHAGASR